MNRFSFKKTKKIFSFGILILFLIFFINKKYFLDNIARPIKLYILSFSGRLIYLVNSCSIPLVEEIPEKSTLIIGHGYGSHELSAKRELFNNGFIAPIIQEILEEQKSKINTVIFSGDLFRSPSQVKWKRLLNDYKEDFEIIISPGNHDIGYLHNDPRREIFSKEILKLDLYPLELYRSGFNLIIDNSIDNKYVYKSFIEKNINTNKSNQIIIRHHIPIRELSYLSNHKGWARDLPSSKIIDQYINNLTFISGDGGAFNYLQRIGCLNFKNNKYIVNGIGENSEDRIIVLNNKRILQYKIYKRNQKN